MFFPTIGTIQKRLLVINLSEETVVDYHEIQYDDLHVVCWLSSKGLKRKMDDGRSSTVYVPRYGKEDPDENSNKGWSRNRAGWFWRKGCTL